MLTVKCPRCKHDQLYDPKIGQSSPTVVGKKKRCVYCGMTFSVHSSMPTTNIVGLGNQRGFSVPVRQ